jgi:hypothetical protein
MEGEQTGMRGARNIEHQGIDVVKQLQNFDNQTFALLRTLHNLRKSSAIREEAWRKWRFSAERLRESLRCEWQRIGGENGKSLRHTIPAEVLTRTITPFILGVRNRVFLLEQLAELNSPQNANLRRRK